MAGDLSSLLPALSALLDRVGERGVNVNVALCDAQEVLDLKVRVAELESANADLLTRCNAAEFRSRCDAIVCMRVIDFARDNGLKIPRKLYDGLGAF